MLQRNQFPTHHVKNVFRRTKTASRALLAFIPTYQCGKIRGLCEYTGLPDHSLHPFEFVWKTGSPATGSGFTFRSIPVPVCDGYSPGYILLNIDAYFLPQLFFQEGSLKWTSLSHLSEFAPLLVQRLDRHEATTSLPLKRVDYNPLWLPSVVVCSYLTSSEESTQGSADVPYRISPGLCSNPSQPRHRVDHHQVVLAVPLSRYVPPTRNAGFQLHFSN